MGEIIVILRLWVAVEGLSDANLPTVEVRIRIFFFHSLVIDMFKF